MRLLADVSSLLGLLTVLVLFDSARALHQEIYPEMSWSKQQVVNLMCFKLDLRSFHELRDGREKIETFSWINRLNFDWTTNGCTAVPDKPFGNNFRPTCVRHDFCYTNLKKNGVFFNHVRKRVDDVFESDLNKQCNGLGFFCNRAKNVYYAGVRAFGELGDTEDFNPYYIIKDGFCEPFQGDLDQPGQKLMIAARANIKGHALPKEACLELSWYRKYVQKPGELDRCGMVAERGDIEAIEKERGETFGPERDWTVALGRVRKFW
ncbi:hypothetical protein CDD83_6470 [Cordyceps sp. RAO-2017]|nr:hypothetical protein CDD83_6470 [Cordyceps sp. RAO-2017]